VLQELEQQCQFVQWIDDEWPSHVGESFKALWKEMKYARRAVDRAHDALEDAMLYTEQMLNARQTMEEEVRHIKRIARRVVLAYQKKAMFATIDKSKLQYLSYFLLILVGVLIVFAIFQKI